MQEDGHGSSICQESEAYDSSWSSWGEGDVLKAQVDYIPYMDELAKMAGCEVDLWDEFKKDPVFAYKLFCGPNVPYVYRLRGPHAWSGAKKAIEGVEYRTKLVRRYEVLC